MTSEHNELLNENFKNVLTEEIVTNCARLHQKLSDVVVQINKCYSFQVIYMHWKSFLFLKYSISISVYELCIWSILLLSIGILWIVQCFCISPRKPIYKGCCYLSYDHFWLFYCVHCYGCIYGNRNE